MHKSWRRGLSNHKLLATCRLGFRQAKAPIRRRLPSLHFVATPADLPSAVDQSTRSSFGRIVALCGLNTAVRFARRDPHDDQDIRRGLNEETR
jgi:hypothetical protein